MLETAYQAKIMKEWTKVGGHNVNGNYTKSGEADLQGGYPVNIGNEVKEIGAPLTPIMILRYLVVEVKTEEDYHRVMKCVKLITDHEGDEIYQIVEGCKGLKKHEPLQIHKINRVRKKGGLALVAWNFEQVKQYVEENT